MVQGPDTPGKPKGYWPDCGPDLGLLVLHLGLVVLHLPGRLWLLVVVDILGHLPHLGQGRESEMEMRVATRLLHPQHLDGIWIGQDQYRMPLNSLSDYPEPWF